MTDIPCETRKGSLKAAHIVRILTTAPIAAGALTLILYYRVPGAFLNGAHAALALFFLCALPLFSYPVSALVPSIRKKGRDGQRKLAIVFSVIGYALGFAACMLLGGAPLEKAMFLTYLLSGTGIALTTLLHFKASGHACGVAGPIFLLAYALGPKWYALVLLLALVFWSSLRLERHTLPQLIGGSVIPLIALMISLSVFGA